MFCNHREANSIARTILRWNFRENYEKWKIILKGIYVI